jgi:alpha-glucosidase
MTRTWPNIISTEGVKGMEHLKWSKDIDPEHNVTLPFSRMFLGPMDYTPGAMLNTQKQGFKIDFKRPMSLGTRAHQLAMYVVYESPLQMLADSPTNYEREPEATGFISRVPTVWDETVVLDARMGDYVVIARRRGADWYLGAMTDWAPRDFELALSFLDEGTRAWKMTSFADGPDAEEVATSCRKTTTTVDHKTRVKFHLARGGGLAAVLTPAATK